MNATPPEHTPGADLLELHHLYLQVPARVDIKYQLVPGREFLLALRAAVTTHPVAQIAELLGVTTSTVYAMRQQPITRHPKRWPSQRQIGPLMRAWAIAKGRGYYSREHLLVRQALLHLWQDGFETIVIARKLKVPVAAVEKYAKGIVVPARSGRAISDEHPGEQLPLATGARRAGGLARLPRR